MQYSVVDGVAVFEGDIVDPTEGPVPEGIVIPGSDRRWPGGIVPFAIAANLPALQAQAARDAVAQWNTNARLNLRPRVAGDAQWIEFQTSHFLPLAGRAPARDESAIHFPFYGDTLDALVDGRPPPDVVVIGTEPTADEQAMIAEALQEARESRGITDAQVMAETGADVVELGLQNAGWLRGIVKALDKHLPGHARHRWPPSRTTSATT